MQAALMHKVQRQRSAAQPLEQLAINTAARCSLA